jgi:hypothetical protein
MNTALLVLLAASASSAVTGVIPAAISSLTANITAQEPTQSSSSEADALDNRSAAGAAQIREKSIYHCDTRERPLSTPVDRFDINADGTLTDFASGLTWMRCALGQTWNGNTCLGKAETFTWDAAHSRAKVLNLSGGYAARKDWRVPRLPELAGIVELQCTHPRINLQLFPNTPEVFFWSASSKPNAAEFAYGLSFGAEGVVILGKDHSGSVRLVRGQD